MIRVLHPAHWSVRTWVAVVLGLGLLGMTGCTSTPAPAPTPGMDPVRTAAADCIVTTTGDYVADYGDMSAATWVAIYDHCTEEAGL